MPPPPSDLRPLIVRYRNQTRQVRERVAAYVRRTWPTEIRDDTVDRWIALVLPLVAAGQIQVAALTDAYLAQYETLITGKAARPLGVKAAAVTTEALRGVPAETVYRRPAIEVWTALSKGATFVEAHALGLDRALSISATDVQLAKTHTSRRILSEKKGVVGYRRVLEGSKSCGLCLVAATQRYHKKELMPIHPGCDCGVQPIMSTDDPGQVIKPEQLAGVHRAIEDRFGAFNSGAREIPGIPHPDTGEPLQYKDVIIEHEHGEIGPVLGVRGQHFDGPSVVD